MGRCILLSIIILVTSIGIEAQIGQKLFGKKRKKIEVHNYTLFLNLHDLALEYSAKVESKVDSLLSTGQLDYNGNIFDFRVRAIQSIQHVLYKSDPLIAYFDGWIFGFQMVEYIESPTAIQYLGPFQPSILVLFKDYLAEWPELHTTLTDESPKGLEAKIKSFADTYPIGDNYLNRTSVVDETALWVGETDIGFKSGVATLTDAMRNASDRFNYYTEFSPKLTQWHIEQSVRNILATDSIGPIINASISSLERLTKTIESYDQLVYSVIDTMLTDMDRQRWETLSFMRAERKAIMEQISLEREIVITQLIEEREILQNMITEERKASFDQIGEIAKDSIELSFDRVDDMVDQLFFRVLMLFSIMAIAIVLAVVIFKRMN